MTLDRIRVPSDSTLTLSQIPVSELADRVMVVGDPARAQEYSALLDDARPMASNREYVSFSGSYKGTPVSIASHGIGGAGANVLFEELCRAGVARIIRAGTAGGLQPEVVDGSIVIATAAVREDGVTQLLVPAQFPAVADPAVVLALEAAASQQELDVHRGIVLTSAVFYPHDVLGSSLEQWQRAGCVAVEMEVAALLVTASLHGVAAGAVLAIDGNPLRQADKNMEGDSPFRDIVRAAVRGAVITALDALVA